MAQHAQQQATAAKKQRKARQKQRKQDRMKSAQVRIRMCGVMSLLAGPSCCAQTLMPHVCILQAEQGEQDFQTRSAAPVQHSQHTHCHAQGLMSPEPSTATDGLDADGRRGTTLATASSLNCTEVQLNTKASPADAATQFMAEEYPQAELSATQVTKLHNSDWAQNELASPEDISRTDSSSEDCIVCWAAAASVIFQPCGHHCCCAACAQPYLTASVPCPLCRQVVTAGIALMSNSCGDDTMIAF